MKTSLPTICTCSCYLGTEMHRKRAHSSLSVSLPLFICVSNRLYVVLRYEMLVLLISITTVLHNGKDIMSSIIHQYKCLHFANFIPRPLVTTDISARIDRHGSSASEGKLLISRYGFSPLAKPTLCFCCQNIRHC
jgi:hypothetical protein